MLVEVFVKRRHAGLEVPAEAPSVDAFRTQDRIIATYRSITPMDPESRRALDPWAGRPGQGVCAVYRHWALVAAMRCDALCASVTHRGAPVTIEGNHGRRRVNKNEQIQPPVRKQFFLGNICKFTLAIFWENIQLVQILGLSEKKIEGSPLFEFSFFQIGRQPASLVKMFP